MTIVKLPKMDEKEIRAAIKNNHLCRIAFIEGKFPYISPFQYVYLNDTLFFHFTDYGRKKEILEENRNVCVSIERFEDDLSSYYFISMQGKLKRVEDDHLKREIGKTLVEVAREIFSTTFLRAHGFEKEKGWDNFSFKDQVFYEFEEIGKAIALKSH